MPRYKLTIEYDGSGFVGWQRQPKDLSVQQAIEDAITGFCGEQAVVYGAGRTDAGVHASGQVAHVDLRQDWPAFKVREATNFYLKPLKIAITDVIEVGNSFEARFSAMRRHYRYRILNRRAPLTFDRGTAWHVQKPLDVAAMQAGGQQLLGKHDFTTFRAMMCQAKSPVRTLDVVEVSRRGDLIEIEVNALSFLHNQVRSIVGSLELVGRGKWSPDDVGAALAAQDRAACGTVAPAHGLYLTRVEYPKTPDQ